MVRLHFKMDLVLLLGALSALLANGTRAEDGGRWFDVVFPAQLPERTEVLLSYGGSGAGEVVAVRRAGATKVQLLWERVGEEVAVSEPVEVAPGRSYRLGIATGLLVGLAPWTERIALDFDGRALLRLRRPAPVASGKVTWRFRENFVGGSLGLWPFSGRVEPAGTWTPAQLAKAQGFDGRGPVRLQLTFPMNRTGRAEPLLVTGRAGRADALYVLLDGPQRIRFGVDHWGGEGKVSDPVIFDPLREHELWVCTEAMLPRRLPGAVDDWTNLRGRLIVMSRGRVIFGPELAAHDFSAEEFFPGRNPLNMSTCDPEFTGQLRVGAPLDARELAELTAARPQIGLAALADQNAMSPGPLELQVRFGPEQPSGRSEPLVVTGTHGAGDVLVIQFQGDGRGRLIFDHWGGPAYFSEMFPAGPGELHRLVVSTDALLPPPLVGADPYARLRGRVVVLLDGRVMLDERLATYPSAPLQVVIGQNAIRATSADAGFRGRIERMEPARLEEIP